MHLIEESNLGSHVSNDLLIRCFEYRIASKQFTVGAKIVDKLHSKLGTNLFDLLINQKILLSARSINLSGLTCNRDNI